MFRLTHTPLPVLSVPLPTSAALTVCRGRNGQSWWNTNTVWMFQAEPCGTGAVNWLAAILSRNVANRHTGKQKYTEKKNTVPMLTPMMKIWHDTSKWKASIWKRQEKVQRTLNCGSRRPPRGVLLTKSCGGSSNAAIIPAMVWCSMQSEKTTFLKSTNWHRRLPLHLPFPFQSKEK